MTHELILNYVFVSGIIKNDCAVSMLKYDRHDRKYKRM